MVKELLYKWFGLEPFPCPTCELLRFQLDESNRERRDMLHRLLDKDKPEPPAVKEDEEPKPLRPAFSPWRVRQQMLEQEDRKAAQLLKEKQKEMDAAKPIAQVSKDIEDLEKELGVNNG